MALRIIDRPTICGLSRSNMEVTTLGLKPFLRKSRWVGKTNRYATNVVKQLEADLPLNAVNKRNLSQYIASSAILHTNDGWSYLGRSIASLIAGDAHRALHLAYYAELRAAMSILASVGVGVFKNDHFVIDGANSASPLHSRAGTHQIAWAALELWSQQPQSGALFAKLIRPGARTLDDWFQPHGGSATLAPQARDWFLQWGMDLRLATKDRDARNESSYRPDGIPTPWIVSSSSVLDFVGDLWRALEPSTPSSFEGIDQSIMRLALEQHFRGLTDTNPSDDRSAFRAMARHTIATQDFTESTAKRWAGFLVRTIAPEDPKIFAYSTLEPGNPETDHFAVISRAVLLLRVATGSAHDLLQQASFDASVLSFWWRAVGETRGLWDPASPPGELSDLWADIRDALSDVRQFAAETPEAEQSTHGLISRMGEHLSVLCSHERVGLWGLCPA